MKNTTLLFLVKKEGDSIKEILLAMKKRGFGSGRINGVGGKVEVGESVEQAVLREAREEIGVEVDIKDLVKFGEINFSFENKIDWNQTVHIFTTEIWTDDIVESEEMKPEWFAVENIPYEHMWDDDKHWLPQILAGKYVKANCFFDDNQKVKVFENL
jgi:8-oxo-dGTP diphosphatase